MRIPLLDRAEAIAAELSRKGADHLYISSGDRGVALALLEQIRKLEQRLQAIESWRDRDVNRAKE